LAGAALRLGEHQKARAVVTRQRVAHPQNQHRALN
jgi:hypothetical protein